MPRSQLAVLLSLVAAGGAAIHAQLPPVSGPVPAVIFDAPAKTFRAVNGMLGFASLGPALADSFESGSAAPVGSHGIAFRQGHYFAVTGLGSAAGSNAIDLMNAGEAAAQAPEGIAWSNDGSKAFVFSRSGNWVRGISGLPGNPQLGPLADLGAITGGGLTAVAVNSNGAAAIAIAGSGDQGGAVWLLRAGANQDPALLFNSPQPALLRFSAAGDKLFVWDRVSTTVSRVELDGSNASSSPAWNFEGLPSLVAIYTNVSKDGRETLWTADSTGESSTLRSFDVSSGTPVLTMELAFKPGMIEALGRDGLLLATRSADGQPIWSLSLSPEPKIYFIPASPVGEVGGSR